MSAATAKTALLNDDQFQPWHPLLSAQALRASMVMEVADLHPPLAAIARESKEAQFIIATTTAKQVLSEPVATTL